MNKLDLSSPESRIFPKILRQQAEQNGATEFLLNDELRINFAEADRITDCLAGGLQSLGLKRGDRMGLYLGNRPEFVLLTLAANKLGAVWVPINTDYKGEWLLDSVERSPCDSRTAAETREAGSDCRLPRVPAEFPRPRIRDRFGNERISGPRCR